MFSSIWEVLGKAAIGEDDAFGWAIKGDAEVLGWAIKGEAEAFCKRVRGPSASADSAYPPRNTPARTPTHLRTMVLKIYD
jgi:hypothetical protein